MIQSNSAPEAKFNGPDLNISLVCPECKVYPPQLIERFSEGDVVCALCGLVLSNRVVDTRSEWRTFSNDDQNGDDPSRVGDAGNPLLEGNQLSTMISFVKSDSRISRDLNRVQNKSGMDKRDINLQQAFSKVSQMCEGYALPKIVQDASKEVYKLVYEERSLKGKSTDSIMAAAIFIGCRQAGVARTFKEIWALTNVPKKEIGKVFKIVTNILNSKDKNLSIRNTQETVKTNTDDLIRRYCSHLGLPTQITNAAEYIATKANEIGILAGRSPITIAATAIYMAGSLFRQQQPLTPAKIADRTGVSDGTIKTSYKMLFERREDLVDPEWIKSGKVNLETLPKL